MDKFKNITVKGKSILELKSAFEAAADTFTDPYNGEFKFGVHDRPSEYGGYGRETRCGHVVQYKKTEDNTDFKIKTYEPRVKFGKGTDLSTISLKRGIAWKSFQGDHVVLEKRVDEKTVSMVDYFITGGVKYNTDPCGQVLSEPKPLTTLDAIAIGAILDSETAKIKGLTSKYKTLGPDTKSYFERLRDDIVRGE